MQDRSQERASEWRRIRELYHENLAKAPPEDADSVKNEYRVAKNKQYRKQFKEDYPQWEVQIDQNIVLQNMARRDMKPIIASFYGVTAAHSKDGFRRPTRELEDYDTKILRVGALFVTSVAFCTMVATYDIYKMSISDTKPSVILNLAAVLLVYYSLKQLAIKPPKNSWEETLVDHVYMDQYKVSPQKPYPNYKTTLQNEATNEQRSH